ncbi:hypothetical protein ACEUAG_14830 [Aeromonas hydrophila]|uniref:hypothetical protein n=1 Tax=Aeromonas hydrophila TaxID=644 RepID=UPI0038CFC449
MKCAIKQSGIIQEGVFSTKNKKVVNVAESSAAILPPLGGGKTKGHPLGWP